MLINDFYNTLNVQQDDANYNCDVVFNSGHSIFSGHFPGHPVVPGVCMMEIVKELVQSALGTSLTLSNAGNVKFLQLITPDTQPQISISWKAQESGYKVSASFKNDSAVLFKMDGSYTPAKELLKGQDKL